MKLFVLPLSQNLVEESAYLGEKQFDVLLLLFDLFTVDLPHFVVLAQFSEFVEFLGGHLLV